MKNQFEGGMNIAMKISKSKYKDTVRFYQDILKLQEKRISHPTISRTHQVKFGLNTLWINCVDNYAHSEIWLELKTPEVPEATDYLKTQGTDTCDELEEIPETMHWIRDPAGTVLLLDKKSR